MNDPKNPANWPDRIIELWAKLAVKKPKLVNTMIVTHIGYSTKQAGQYDIQN